jgi:tetratricopeptide (TPR) repeat protein
MRVLLLSFLLPLVASSGCIAADTPHPWIHAQDVLAVTIQDIKSSGGIRGIEKDVPDLEKELASAVPTGAAIPVGDDEAVVLTDGMTQMLIMMVAVKDKKFKKVSSLASPYPRISLYLGSYYNEVGRPEDALRVLNAGIAISDVDGMGLGEHDPVLVTEKGAAFQTLKRFDDALATYKFGLKLASDEDRDRARMFRGIGFSLTELGRLDDAESAYRKSLLCEPGNAHAQDELQYIAQLRAGKPATPGSLATVLPQSDTEATKGSCPKE